MLHSDTSFCLLDFELLAAEWLSKNLFILVILHFSPHNYVYSIPLFFTTLSQQIFVAKKKVATKVRSLLPNRDRDWSFF